MGCISNDDQDTLQVHLVLYSSRMTLGLLVMDLERCLDLLGGVELLTSDVIASKEGKGRNWSGKAGPAAGPRGCSPLLALTLE